MKFAVALDSRWGYVSHRFLSDCLIEYISGVSDRVIISARILRNGTLIFMGFMPLVHLHLKRLAQQESALSLRTVHAGVRESVIGLE